MVGGYIRRMPTPNILIVSVDGLRASSLGAYGNTTFATPSLDEFAAESFLLDGCHASAVELPVVYRALWQARHPLRPAMSGPPTQSLPHILGSRGYSTTLVTDERGLSSSNQVREFDEIVDVGARPDYGTRGVRAGDLTQTSMAPLFAAACDAVALGQSSRDAANVSDQSAPRLIWVHSQGLYGPWDAPLDLQRSLLDEGDPPSVESSAPPDLNIDDAHEPDSVFQYSCAYAAQVMVLDDCWRVLMESIDSNQPSDRWLVVLIGTRGYPLGEHGRIGGVDARLYTEQLHVPWIIRFPNGLGRLGRSGALTSHFDLLPTILGWLDDGSAVPLESADGMDVLPRVRAARAEWRETLLAASATSRAIRTPAWCLRQDVPFGSSLPETATEAVAGDLYVRPDDRWEANDVAKLCPDVVDALSQTLDDAWQHVLRNEPIPIRSARIAHEAT
jgi:arylsulfatase A-like enzyme